MNTWLFIFLGGGFGSLARFTTSKWIGTFHLSIFPLATLSANAVSSLLLGIFLGITSHIPNDQSNLKYFIAVGFCGGFSTFSTFSAETFELIKHGMLSLAFLNILISTVVCIGFIGIGMLVSKMF